jgi:hypothetical protein
MKTIEIMNRWTGAVLYADARLPERFWLKTKIVGDCWEWTGSRSGSGYGRIKINGRLEQAHRVAFALTEIGALGLELDHVCRNRRCVNPAHLEAVSRRENILRGTSPTAINAAKTHCSRGHELSDENVSMVRSRGARVRQCRECNKAKQRKRRADLVACAADDCAR